MTDEEMKAMARRICANAYVSVAFRETVSTGTGDTDECVARIRANYIAGHYDNEMEMRAVLAAIIETRDRDAALAYRVCAETRHVTLGDKVSAAIRSGQQFRKDV